MQNTLHAEDPLQHRTSRMTLPPLLRQDTTDTHSIPPPHTETKAIRRLTVTFKTTPTRN